MGIKDVLTLEKDPVALVKELETIINDELGIPMDSEAICKILREVKQTRQGQYVFSEFLYYCGNPDKIKTRKNKTYVPGNSIVKIDKLPDSKLLNLKLHWNLNFRGKET